MNFEALDNFSASDIIDFKTIDISKITFSSPTRVKGGSYMSIPTYQGKKIYIQTPRLLNTNGIVKNDNRSYLELEFDKSHWSFYEFITDIDDYNIIQIQKNSENWFSKEFPLDIVEEFYKSPVKVGRGKKPPSLKIKVPISRGQISCAIYDKANQLIRYSDIPNKSKILCVLCLTGLRFLKQQVICEWQPIQLKVFFTNNNPKPSYVINDSLLSDDESEPVVEVEKESEPVVNVEKESDPESVVEESVSEPVVNVEKESDPEPVVEEVKEEVAPILEVKEVTDEANPVVEEESELNALELSDLETSLEEIVVSEPETEELEVSDSTLEDNLEINENQMSLEDINLENESELSRTELSNQLNLDNLQKYKDLLNSEYAEQLKNINQQQLLLKQKEDNTSIDYQSNIDKLNNIIQEKDKRLQLLENKIKELINFC